MDNVSIVVPIYNKDWCIARCINSVLAQTWKDFTLILVDDGSKDNSLALCQEYAAKDSRIQVVAKENGGVSTARNAGIEVSTGRYILFLDADDWWEPDFLETMISLTEENGANTMVMCSFFRSSDKELPVMFDPASSTLLAGNGIYEIYRRHFLNMLWNKVFLGSIIREKNIRFPVGIHWGEDKLFILQYLKNISCYRIINRPLYHYYVSDSGLDNRFKKDELQLNQMLHQALFDFEESLPWKTHEGHLMLCSEYMRVQLFGALRQIKATKSVRYTRELTKDSLLARCMADLHRAKKCSRWLCLCQKHSALMLISSYAINKKLHRS